MGEPAGRADGLWSHKSSLLLQCSLVLGSQTPTLDRFSFHPEYIHPVKQEPNVAGYLPCNRKAQSTQNLIFSSDSGEIPTTQEAGVRAELVSSFWDYFCPQTEFVELKA